MQIIPDDLTGAAIAAFLEEHLRDMRAISPPESVHALDLDGLRRPEVSFWSLWLGESIAGCAALKQLDARHGEVKSMRTASHLRRQGIASILLQHLVHEATIRGYRRLSLETGSMPFFAPAHGLYQKFGFVPCGPFGTYREDPHSVFFTKALG
jgi:putative acetyltransferase